jgi:peptidoglycan/LPS O-acetylase OafA/YrhL
MVTVMPLLVRLSPGEWFHAELRNQNLEGLRGWLAPAVFYHHAVITYFFYVKNGVWELPPSEFYLRLGPGAVLLFFFLTGYLFWSQNLDQRRPWDLKDFFSKRLRRLLPAFYLATLLVLISALAAQGGLAEPVTAVAGELWSWLVFGLPFGQVQNLNGFALTPRVMAGVYWTLRFEWLFYRIFPLLRHCKRWSALLALLVLCFLLRKVLTGMIDVGAPHQASSLALQTIVSLLEWLVFGFGLGMLVSYLRGQTLAVRWASTRVAQIVALLTLFMFFRAPVVQPYSTLLLGLLFTVVALDQKCWQFLHRRVFQLLGQMSYGIYLYHGIVLFWVFRWLDRFTPVAQLSWLAFWSVVTVCGAMTLIFSYLSFRFLEKPLIQSRAARRRQTPSLPIR